jgi:hypothetical protein
MTALPFLGTEDEVIAKTRDADALVTSASPVTRSVMSALEGLKVVARTVGGLRRHREHRRDKGPVDGTAILGPAPRPLPAPRHGVDPVTLLETEHGDARARQPPRHRRSGSPGAHDQDVDAIDHRPFRLD